MKILLYILIFNSLVFSQEWERVFDLRGKWKFSIGDNLDWSKNSYNDKDWVIINAPSSWENQGFHGYNGYAWYRKHFNINSDYKERNVYLHLGYIDDVDEVYVNGNLIGSSGSFPPNYQTSYNTYRIYPVPEKFLRFDAPNLIAVRIYDAQLEGGLMSGNLGVYVQKNVINPDQNLEGSWKFITGDNKEWLKPEFDDKDWNSIIVPGTWETQGYKDYDGFAWYRKSFALNNKLTGRQLVLMLGKIDDIDEVYLNGTLIGNTGVMNDNPYEISFNNEWNELRGYYIPQGLLKNGGENIIAVRVFDGFQNGGIYQGPVGLITQERYIKFWNSQNKKRSFWNWFFE